VTAAEEAKLAALVRKAVSWSPGPGVPLNRAGTSRRPGSSPGAWVDHTRPRRHGGLGLREGTPASTAGLLIRGQAGSAQQGPSADGV